MSHHHKYKPRTILILRFVVWFLAINIFIYFSVGSYFGGDAAQGYVRAGHYFICAKGSCREVSRTFWNLSYYQALSALASFAVICVIAAICKNSKHNVCGSA
jgi:hypothetical protein